MTLDDIAVRIGMLTQQAMYTHNYSQDLLRDAVEVIREHEHKAETDPLQEALWQVREWTAQANQLRRLLDETRSENTLLRERIRELEDGQECPDSHS